MLTPGFLVDAPRHLFLTGKGGVGKTSVACAAAVALARAGRRVLLVSTDPASNVGQVLGLRIGATVTPVAAVPGLSALEIDPEEVAAAHRERVVGPVRGILPDAEVALVEEQLAGACTTEIASFDAFTALLVPGGPADDVDHVVFDTAPTGHTIRLLRLPTSWTRFLQTGGDASCLGPLAGLDRRREEYAQAVDALADPARTRLVLVTRAQRAAVDEVARTHAELAALGMSDQRLVVNAVLGTPASDDPLAHAVAGRERAVLATLPAALAELPRDVLPLRARDVVGLPALDALLTAAAPEAATLPDVDVPALPDAALRLDDLVDEIAAQGHGLVMTVGKGGVGKTTVAAALAVALADRGVPVHLTTTDPAAHVSRTLAGDVPGLEVSRIDPEVETERYRQTVLRRRGGDLDDAGRANLEEDLRSPCTEEVAVFHAFSRVVHEARRRVVVVDTAPTGHTLLLLDAAGSYHRDVARQVAGTASFTTPMMRLQDPAHTRVVVVTTPEPTPVLEAEGLAADLRRAGIEPWAWVIDGSLAAAGTTDPLLRLRAADQAVQIDRVVAVGAPRCAVVPLLAADPVGPDALRDLVRARAGAPV